jgi:hypothetical protein
VGSGESPLTKFVRRKFDSQRPTSGVALRELS